METSVTNIPLLNRIQSPHIITINIVNRHHLCILQNVYKSKKNSTLHRVLFAAYVFYLNSFTKKMKYLNKVIDFFLTLLDFMTSWINLFTPEPLSPALLYTQLLNS